VTSKRRATPSPKACHRHLHSAPCASPNQQRTVTINPDAQLSVSPTTSLYHCQLATPQTVTVTAFNTLTNEFAHTGTINHSATSADTNYNAIGIDGLLVNITDNDNTAPVVNADRIKRSI